jgi:hypothetical protein
MAAELEVVAEAAARDGVNVVVASVMAVAGGAAWLEAKVGWAASPEVLVVQRMIVAAKVIAWAAVVVECRQARAGVVELEEAEEVLAVLSH